VTPRGAVDLEPTEARVERLRLAIAEIVARIVRRFCPHGAPATAACIECEVPT